MGALYPNKSERFFFELGQFHISFSSPFQIPRAYLEAETSEASKLIENHLDHKLQTIRGIKA